MSQKLIVGYCNAEPVINESAFDGKLLSSVIRELPSSVIGEKEAVYEFDNLTKIGRNAFTDARRNKNFVLFSEVTLPDSVVSFAPDSIVARTYEGKLFTGDDFEIIDGALIKCHIKDEVIEIPMGVTSIAPYAFDDTFVEKVSIPATVKEICHHAFCDCNHLTSVKFVKGLEIIGDCAFEGTEIKSITIPDTVISIGSEAFGSMFKLKKIKFGKGVKSIGDSVLFNAFKLSEINGKYATEDKFALICEGRFLAYANKAELPEYHIPEGVTCIASGAFRGIDWNLKTVNIPESVVEIEEGAFRGSSIKIFTGKFSSDNNRTVIIGNRLIAAGYNDLLDDALLIIPTNVTEIADFACAGNVGISQLTWHDGITRIGRNAFCGQITRCKWTPVLPAELVEIGELAFYNPYTRMSLFEDGVIIPSKVKRIGKEAITSPKMWFEPTDPPMWDIVERDKPEAIFVPAHSLNAYKEAYPQFADKIVVWER